MLDVQQQIADLNPGDHLCLLYEDRLEQLAAVIPYVQVGLDRGERFIYVADDLTPNAILAELTTARTDVQRAIDAGQLIVLNNRESDPAPITSMSPRSW